MSADLPASRGIDPADSAAETSVDGPPLAPVTPGMLSSEPAYPLALPRSGARIGQYEIIRELGRGGMGAVFVARDTRLGRKVAIKFLYSNRPEVTTRFVLEARATARCSHENIVVIHEVGEHRGHPFMVLEHLRGVPLTRLLDDDRRLSPAQALELLVPVVRALVVAHENNIVHRDLKPDNIFVTDTGTVKVLDFGIAKLVHGDQPSRSAMDDVAAMGPELDAGDNPQLTRRGSLVGTLPYMSPEQWGVSEVDHRTDLWAVGILLFRMVAGKHPLHPRQGHGLMITALLDEPMPGVRSACPGVPDDLADVIDRCLIKRKEERIASARELLAVLEPLLPGRHGLRLPSNENPFAGLHAFQEADSHRFFGRTREIAAAVARLRDQPVLGIVGPSGVGKSSFVRAGILPALKASGDDWTRIVVRPGRQPVAALASAIAPLMMTSTTTTVSGDLSERTAVLERLYREPGYLGAVLRSRARQRGQHILLFVDQFEELYTQVAEPEERLAFTACLASVCDDVTTPLRLVLSIRSDFLDFVPEDPHFMAELAQGLFFLSPPDRAGLRDALCQPLEMAGFRLEDPGMVEAMLDHLEHAPGALPLLQFAASQLWELRDDERRLLTRDSYDRIGGIEGAFVSHAEKTWSSFATQEQGIVRALLLRLITPERTRAVVPIHELHDLGPAPGEIRRLLDQLIQARLLVTRSGVTDDGASDRASIELVHESLIHSWPRLRRWLDESQDDAMFLAELRHAARQWQTRGYPQGLLWRGEALEEARLWARRYRGELPEVQRAYLQAVFDLSARAARRRRLGVIAVIVFLSALVAAAGVALVMIQDARQKAKAQAALATEQRDRARAAETRATQDRETTLAVKDQLEAKNTALVAAVDAAERARVAAEILQREAEEARVRAEKSRRRERRSKRREMERAEEARRARGVAEAASAEADRKRAELATLLAREKERVDELQRATGQKARIYDDVTDSERDALVDRDPGRRSGR